MTKSALLILVVFITGFFGCIEETDTEKEKPVIELLSPVPCDTLYFGEALNYQIKIIDNTGLGNISMDVHNNFGHHSHGQHESCAMDPPKDAVTPYSNSWIFSLPADSKEHIFETSIQLPAMKNDTALFDPGDYHFHIYVTDNDGYQTFTTMDVKILQPDSF